MKFKTLHTIADAIGARRYKRAATLIDRALESEPGQDWNRHLGRLAEICRDYQPRFSILAEGNSKLPFLAFGVLPGVSCPGAGDCLDFCYSFKAWRYPAAFARQAQNLILVRENFGAIESAFDKHYHGAPVDFRLYVDGDFDSVETVNRWFKFLAANDWLITYGYSKSFNELRAGIRAPDNYKLNLSSGHNHSPRTVAAIRQMKIYRGDFIAVDIGRPVKSADHGDRAHQKELRQAYGAPAFTCPGSCGDCLPDGAHACGSDRFKNVDIIIAAH